MGHLEMRTEHRAGAEFLADVARSEGIALSVQDRGRHAVAYAKGSEPIAELLALAGAPGAVLTLAERAVVGAAKARANRLANADHANLVRSSRAAGAQLRALRRLERRGALARLPDELQELAALTPSAPGAVAAGARLEVPSDRHKGNRAPETPEANPARGTVKRRAAEAALALPWRGDAGLAGVAVLSPERPADRQGDRRAGGEAPRTTSPSS